MAFYHIIQRKHQGDFTCNEKQHVFFPWSSFAPLVKAVSSAIKEDSRSTELYRNQTRFGLDPSLNSAVPPVNHICNMRLLIHSYGPQAHHKVRDDRLNQKKRILDFLPT